MAIHREDQEAFEEQGWEEEQEEVEGPSSREVRAAQLKERFLETWRKVSEFGILIGIVAGTAFGLFLVQFTIDSMFSKVEEFVEVAPTDSSSPDESVQSPSPTATDGSSQEPSEEPSESASLTESASESVEERRESRKPLKPNEILDMITVAERVDDGTYDRDLFKHWEPAVESFSWKPGLSGCNARQATFARDSLNDLVWEDKENCVWRDNRWRDFLGDGTLKSDNPSDFDIDHVVPLKLAWISGAQDWDDSLRTQFANDSWNLIIADPSVNRSKGSKGAEEFLPTGPSACYYAETYIIVKYDYSLTITSDEKMALREQMEQFC